MAVEDVPDVQEVEWEDWVMVSWDWWRSSYAEVDWAYSPRHHWTETGLKLSYHPRPPCYHDTLYTCKDGYGSSPSLEADVELNPGLVGAQGAESAMGPYERNTHITGYFDSMFSLDVQLVLPEDASEQEIQQGREQWAEQVDTLLGILRPVRPALPQPQPGDARIWDLNVLDDGHYDDFDQDIIDLTDSDLSMDSDPGPTTPQADKKSYASVVFIERSPHHSSHDGQVISPSPAKPLNASALSFVPAYNLPHSMPSPPSPEAPYVSPTYEYHFPSLGTEVPRADTRSLPPLQRDEQGFYNEILPSNTQSRSSTPKRPPPSTFTNNASASRQSKTREIVDRIRHSTSSASRRNRKNKAGESNASRRPAAEVVSTEQPEASEYDLEVVDGWITGVDTRQSSKGKKEPWVQGLFQSSAQGQAQGHGRPQSKQSNHKRSVSAATSSTNTSFTPATPSSVASTLSALPTPPPSIAHFQFYAFQQPYAGFPAAPYAVPAMMQPWQMVAAPTAYMMPPPLYAPALPTYDARKTASRHA